MAKTQVPRQPRATSLLPGVTATDAAASPAAATLSERAMAARSTVRGLRGRVRQLNGARAVVRRLTNRVVVVRPFFPGKFKKQGPAPFPKMLRKGPRWLVAWRVGKLTL